MVKKLLGTLLIALGIILILGAIFQLPHLRLHEGGITPYVAGYIAGYLISTLLFIALGGVCIHYGRKMIKPVQVKDI